MQWAADVLSRQQQLFQRPLENRLVHHGSEHPSPRTRKQLLHAGDAEHTVVAVQLVNQAASDNVLGGLLEGRGISCVHDGGPLDVCPKVNVLYLDAQAFVPFLHRDNIERRFEIQVLERVAVERIGLLFVKAKRHRKGVVKVEHGAKGRLVRGGLGRRTGRLHAKHYNQADEKHLTV